MAAMTQSVLEGVTRRADHLRALTDPSRNEAKSRAFLLDVTEGLRSCALLRDYLTESCKLLWTDAIDGEMEEIDFTGRMCLYCLSVARKTFGAVRDRADELRAASQDVPAEFDRALADFDQAAQDVEALEKDFQDRWPWLDADKYQRSVAAERQGVRRRSLQEVHDDVRRRVR